MSGMTFERAAGRPQRLAQPALKCAHGRGGPIGLMHPPRAETLHQRWQQIVGLAPQDGDAPPASARAKRCIEGSQCPSKPPAAGRPLIQRQPVDEKQRQQRTVGNSGQQGRIVAQPEITRQPEDTRRNHSISPAGVGKRHLDDIAARDGKGGGAAIQIELPAPQESLVISEAQNDAKRHDRRSYPHQPHGRWQSSDTQGFALLA